MLLPKKMIRNESDYSLEKEEEFKREAEKEWKEINIKCKEMRIYHKIKPVAKHHRILCDILKQGKRR